MKTAIHFIISDENGYTFLKPNLSFLFIANVKDKKKKKVVYTFYSLAHELIYRKHILSIN